jgi:fucose permease
LNKFLGTDNAIEDAYFGFFTTYTVKEYGWPKKKGSYAASVYWTAYAFGRFSAIFIVPYFKPSILLRIYSKLLVISVTGLFIKKSKVCILNAVICSQKTTHQYQN